ncbi:MAG: ABC transporter ATP-binding protein [Rhodococcus sp.]|nr:ABC transporter ATP-binding protein [Rhodococcus sp. (in: high G+C Gram-positive bacteria)]
MSTPAPEPSTLTTLRRVVALLRPYPGRTALALGLGVPLVACVTASPLILRYIIDEGLTANSQRALLIGAALMASVALVQFSCATLRRRTGGRLAVDAQRDLRLSMARKLASLDAAWFDQARTGGLLTRVSSDIDAVRAFLGFGFAFIVIDGLTMAIALTQMWLLDVRLTVLTLVFTIPTLILALWFNSHLRVSFHRLQERRSEVTSVVHEAAAGISVVKTAGISEQWNDKFAARAGELHTEAKAAIRLRSRFAPLITALPQITAVTILLVGGIATINGSLSLGTLVAFNVYVAMVAALAAGASQLVSSAQRAAVGGSRVFEVLDAQPLITSRPGAAALPPGKGAEIALRDIEFRSLQGATWRVPAGRHVVVRGAAATGKTTLAQLLVRDYDPDAGTVFIDGFDATTLTVDSLRSQVIRTQQDALMIAGTLRDNLLLGSAVELDRIRDVLHAVDALDWVVDGDANDDDALQAGLDRRISERGVDLSGGQRQRIAMARAILRSPRVLILDGALSEVDAATEAKILARLPEVLTGTTVIYLGTSSPHLRVDDTYELRDGRIHKIDDAPAEDDRLRSVVAAKAVT